MRIFELTLKLFNAVPKGGGGVFNPELIGKALKFGILVDTHSAYLLDDISAYFTRNKLSGEQLNTTFHKSWGVIKDSTREELLVHQVLHYCTTYGTDFTLDFIYIPVEELEVPDLKVLPLRVVKGLDNEELVAKCLGLITSGVALSTETIDDVLSLLNMLDYQFKSVDNIRNKEALIKVISKTGLYPSNPVEFLRYLVFLATGSTLLIKDPATILEIKTSMLDIAKHLEVFGLEKCATIFNRFKPLWLAFKANGANIPAINKIAKLSKTRHVPMPVDVLNNVTSGMYTDKEIHTALKIANPFRKMRLLNALNARVNGADKFLYRVRNGKSYVKGGSYMLEEIVYYTRVFMKVYNSLKDSLDVEGKVVRYPNNIDYALPSSEKMFVGNIPAGTRISGEYLVSGIYWENDWGARDLDLSALALTGKVGWNSDYTRSGLMFSGDMTDASNGATELLYTDGDLDGPAMSVLNVFRGEVGCKFKIIIGNAEGITQNYMFNPNELILEVMSETKGRQQILGITMPNGDGGLDYILVNTGFGSTCVSGGGKMSKEAREALYHQFSNPVSFRKLLIDAGATIVDEGAGGFDIDLLPNSLQKDSLINLFK